MILCNPRTGQLISETTETSLQNEAKKFCVEMKQHNLNFKSEKHPLTQAFKNKKPDVIHVFHKQLGIVKRFDIDKKLHYSKQVFGYNWRLATDDEIENHLAEEAKTLEAYKVQTTEALRIAELNLQNKALDILAKNMEGIKTAEKNTPTSKKDR